MAVAVGTSFSVLGPVEVARDGAALDLGGARQRAVLARLLVARRAVVPVDRLIDDVWSGEPSESAQGVLQAYVSRLRRVLEPGRAPRTPAALLTSRPPGYALEADADAELFATLLADGADSLAGGDPAAALRTLEEAARLWRGDPYADLADEPWARAEIGRLSELRLVAREHGLAARLAMGQAHAAVAELEQLVVEQPLREGLWRLLAQALYRSSRQADALEALSRARGVLRDELGLDPSPALRELEAAILAHAPELGLETTLSTLPATPMPPAATAALSSGGAQQVFGRGTALRELREVASGVVAEDRPAVVVVSGAAGIGKTWLVQGFSRELAEQGWRVCWASSHDGAGAPPLWPWLEILGQLDAEHPTPEALRQLLDAAADVPDRGDARFRQQESIRRHLVSVAAAAPLLLVLDDVHWADAASLQLLAHIVSATRNGTVLAVALSRPDVGQRHEGSLVRLDRLGRRLTLSPLDEHALAEMASAAGLDVPGDLLLARTGGHPLFVRETLRLVEQAGRDAGLGQVPESVGDIIRQRVSALAPETREVLLAAAVLGREVDLDALVELSDRPEAEVWDAVDAAVVAGVLLDAGGGLAFAHDLLREAVYADLPPLRRARLHLRALEALRPRSQVEASRLAEHAHAAGPQARTDATTWAAAAAREASRRFAHDDAVRWWMRAVEAQGHESAPDPALEVELLLSLMSAQVDSGDAVAARETRNRAIVAADALDDAPTQTRALLALDSPALWLLRQFNEPELRIVARLERTLADTPVEDSEQRCRVLATLAIELYDGVLDPRCAPLAAEAVAMARRLGRPDLLAVSLNAAYLANNRELPPPDTLANAEELVAIGTAEGWPKVTLLGHQLAANMCFYHADVERADQHAAEADRLVRRLDLVLPRMQALAFHVARLQLDGAFDEAAERLRQEAELQLSWWAMDGLIAAQWLTQLFVAARLEEADDSLVEAAGMARPTLAHDVRLLTGRTEPSGRPWPEPVRDWGWLAMTVVRSETAARFGSPAARRAAYDALAPYAGRFAYSASFAAPVDWYLARLATSLGEREASRRHLNALEAACERESLDWWADRARAALAG